MPNYCCVKGCKSKQIKSGPITFHKLPTNEIRRAQWIEKIGKKLGANSKVCSKHFEVECFDREKFGGTWLKATAVPTIFDFSTEKVENSSANEKKSPQLQNSLPRRAKSSAPVSTTSIDEASNIDDDDDATSIDEASDSKSELSSNKRKKKAHASNKTEKSTKRKRMSYLGDFKEGVAYSNDELFLGLKIANKLVKQQNKKLRCLKGMNSRLRKRVEHLNDVLEEYKKKVYIPSDILKEALARNKKIYKANLEWFCG